MPAWVLGVGLARNLNTIPRRSQMIVTQQSIHLTSFNIERKFIDSGELPLTFCQIMIAGIMDIVAIKSLNIGYK